MEDKRIKIIIGHYGSGKTEFAVNHVINMAKDKTMKVAIADLDIVNPYFRSRDQHEMLESKGIKVISGSLGHNVNLDLPALSAGIIGPLQDKNYKFVMDVGGDAAGATVLARFKRHIIEHDYDMFCVVNGNRPDTKTVEGVIKHINEIQSVTGLQVTGLINNTHLLRDTSSEDVLRGQKICEGVSKALQLPIKYVCVLEKVAQTLSGENLQGEIVPIKMYMREEWM